MTSGQAQRHPVFEWLCKHNRLRPEPIRFEHAQRDVNMREQREHAQRDGKSVKDGLGADQKERGLWGREWSKTG